MVIKVNLGQRTYPIIIQNGLLDKIGTLNAIRYTLDARRIVIITDKNVASFYLNRVVNSLKSAGFKSVYKIIPAGEGQKSLSTVNRLYDFLVRHKVERNDAIIALGGGVIGDLAGFAAATYKRGLNLIQMPTSLVAQVDSGIGGKTGVNHRMGKNLVGVFYQPKLVLIDPLTLKTLPKKEFYNGMAEVIKIAIIKDKQLFGFLWQRHKEIMELNPGAIETIIHRAVIIKKHIVEQDEFDTKGKRIILNYGHTIGHIIESMGRYKNYRHGEAVAVGMMAAARIAQRMHLVDECFTMKQAEMLKMYNLPIRLKEPLKFTQMIKFLEQDKKIKGGKIHEVLPNRIGSVRAYQIPLNKFR